MGLLYFRNRGVKYLLCVIDWAKPWAKPLKNKKAKIVLNGFIEIVNESKCKPNKSWANQGKFFFTMTLCKNG